MVPCWQRDNNLEMALDACPMPAPDVKLLERSGVYANQHLATRRPYNQAQAVIKTATERELNQRWCCKTH